MLNYSKDDVKTALRNPSQIPREIGRLIETPVKPIQRRYFRLKYGTGIDVMDADWDNLIILDACRYDFFDEEHSMDGDLRPIVSAGRNSWQFMASNFQGQTFHDTIYITANPFVYRLSSDVFFSIENMLTEWDEDVGTVYPGSIVERAKKLHKSYPDKRLIIHFMQPHLPYIGTTADAVRERIDLRGFKHYHGWNETRGQGSGISWWRAVQLGHITPEETRDAYRESLNIVLANTADLLSTLDGKSVVTADHGEMLGERIFPLTHRRFGHSVDTYTPELCIVPWFEAEYDSRRNIIPEDPLTDERLNYDIISDRLETLGYVPE